MPCWFDCKHNLNLFLAPDKSISYRFMYYFVTNLSSPFLKHWTVSEIWLSREANFFNLIDITAQLVGYMPIYSANLHFCEPEKSLVQAPINSDHTIFQNKSKQVQTLTRTRANFCATMSRNLINMCHKTSLLSD